VGAEDGVDPGRPLEDLVPVLLGQAAADGDLQAGPLLFEGPELAEVAVKPVVGVFPYAAGVEDHDVGVLGALRRDHPFGLRTRPARRSESCSFIWQPNVRTR
jgi:hypothetical protein